MTSDLADRIARIRAAEPLDFPAWVNDAPPPVNPRAPTPLNDQIDIYTLCAERDAVRTEVADCRRRIEALITLVTVLHDETQCVPPCRHLGLIDELVLG